MDDFNTVEDRLHTAFDDVRRLEPDPDGLFPAVTARAQRRAATQRLVAVAAALVIVVAAAAAVALTDDDADGRVAVTGPAPDEPAPVEPAPTSTTTTTTTPLPVEVPVPVLPTPAITTKPTTTTTTTTPPGHEPSPQPHAAKASVKGQEVDAVQGSYCWRGGDGQAGLCADTSSDYADDAPVLDVTAEDVLSFRWATNEQPKDVAVFAWARRDGKTDFTKRIELGCDGGNPCRILLSQAKLPPGEYVLHVASYWVQGDVMHGIRLALTA